uniref:ATP synthase F0 subunit 8 n=1 Tax=Panagrolaimus sp. JU765 TaxID=591449 RepID=A0AC34PWA5_9BILA
MFLIVTICVLFLYTVLLIALFARWCSISSTMFYAQKELPLASIKSPRRNTKFIELENGSATSQISQSVEFLHRKFSLMDGDYGGSYTNLVFGSSSQKPNDYLHPKYSLPPMKIDVSQQLYEFDKLLRTPAKIPIRSKKLSHSSMDSARIPGGVFVV